MKLKSRMRVTQSQSAMVGALIGIVISLAISLIFVVAMTSMVINNKFVERSLGWSIFVVRMISALVGTLVGTGLAKEKCAITIAIITVGYLVVLIGLGIVIFDESFKNFGAGLVSTIFGGIVGFLIRLKLQNKPRRSRKIKT